MQRRYCIRLAAALAVASAALFAVIAAPFGSAGASFWGPSVASVSGPGTLDVQILSPGTLVARGVAVDVTVDFPCDASGERVSLYVRVTQRVGADVARGFGSGSPTCQASGREQFVVRVGAENKAFRHGTALAEVDIFACAATCDRGHDSAEIEIRKAKR
jgi:hypothetical protein